MAYKSAATKRYLRRFIPTIIAYVVVLFAAIWAIRAYQPTGTALVVLSILPSLPILVTLAVIGLYVAEEQDEYLRNRIVMSMMIGTGVVLAVATVLGFLQIGGVIGMVEVFWAFPIWCASWGLVQCVLTMRDRPEAEQ